MSIWTVHSPERAFEDYDKGHSTRGEVFFHLLKTLDPSNLDYVRSELVRWEMLDEFERMMVHAKTNQIITFGSSTGQEAVSTVQAVSVWYGSSAHAE